MKDEFRVGENIPTEWRLSYEKQTLSLSKKKLLLNLITFNLNQFKKLISKLSKKDVVIVGLTPIALILFTSAVYFCLSTPTEWKDCCPTVDGIKLNVDYISKQYDESNSNISVDVNDPFIREKLPRYMPLEVKNGYVRYRVTMRFYGKSERSSKTEDFLKQHELLLK